MLHHALILASIAMGTFAGEHEVFIMSSYCTSYYTCKGPNTGTDVILEIYNYTSRDFNCIPYAPPKGSNIFVTFGFPGPQSIDVFSDDHCKTQAANTLTLGGGYSDMNEPTDSSQVTKCILMETAGWADGKSAKLNWS